MIPLTGTSRLPRRIFPCVHMEYFVPLAEMKLHCSSIIRACSYGQKLSRLARKLFDKFTSEISPCYENNMKSYIAFI